MKLVSIIAGGIIFGLTLPAGAANVSTNPDTPTTLKVNTIVGQMLQGDGKSFDNYYAFKAGPGMTTLSQPVRAIKSRSQPFKSMGVKRLSCTCMAAHGTIIPARSPHIALRLVAM